MFSCKQKHHTPFLQISHQPQHFCSNIQLPTNNQAIAKIKGTSFILLASKSTWKYTKLLSHVVCFHIINPYTQFAGRVLFHRALYASSRGSVSHACRPPQHLPPLIGRHPETTLSPLSLTDVNLLDQIPCCSHIWGYWGSLQKFGPQETQPRKQKDAPVW